MKPEISVAIVIYNKSCEDSETCRTILRNAQQPDRVLVLDNSTRGFPNADFCEKHGWFFRSMGGNAGLSKAYNTALELLKKSAGLIVWADDDTGFPENYFSVLSACAQAHPESSLFLPVVLSGERRISPSIAGKYRVTAVQSSQELEGRPVTAINSGLAVRGELYRKDGYSYDESIFLDCIDHDFMRWCRLNGKNWFLMEDAVLRQSFFTDSKPERNAALFRRKIFVRDFLTYSRKCGNSRLVTRLQLLKGRIRLELTCKH